MRSQHGFTLIELMIVVAVIAILAAIAIPNFLEQSRKGRRAEAARGIGELQMAVERWRADNPCYGQSNAGGCPTFTASGTYPSLTEASSANYTVTIPTATATTYTILATRGGKQASDRCGNLSVTRGGRPTWSGDADCNN